MLAKTGGGKKGKQPDTKNALDTTMAWGDILTLFATELVGPLICQPRAPNMRHGLLILKGLHCLQALHTMHARRPQGPILVSWLPVLYILAALGGDVSSAGGRRASASPLSLCGMHCSISILTWVAVACLKGDYRVRPLEPGAWFGGQQEAMLLAMSSGAVTWVCSATFCCAMEGRHLAWFPTAVAGPGAESHGRLAQGQNKAQVLQQHCGT